MASIESVQRRPDQGAVGSTTRRRVLAQAAAGTAGLLAGRSLLSPLVAAAGGPRAATRSKAAEHFVLSQFRRHSLVGLGEPHWLQEFHDFLQSLLRNPALPGTVDDVVVEFGNSLYQDLVDAYVNGGFVSEDELRLVWRNTTVSPQQTWDAPVYEQLFRSVRAVNWTLPSRDRLRVLLADPPINWSNSGSVHDVIPFLERRDRHWAEVIEEHVLRKRRKALVVCGGVHLIRGFEIPPHSGRSNLTTTLGSSGGAARRMYVIETHTGFRTPAFEKRLGRGRGPVIHDLSTDRSLGRLPASESFFWMQKEDLGGRTLAQVADAYLFLKPPRQLTSSVPNPNVFRDPAYFTELQRRAKLFGDPPPVDVATYLLQQEQRYPDVPGAAPGGPVPIGPGDPPLGL